MQVLARTVLGVAAAAALLALPAPAQAAFPGTDGKIAFSTNQDGNYEIYTMNADGTGKTRLTTNAADDITPAWSPRGDQLAFSRGGTIFKANADGTGRKRLGPGEDPAWSPDGQKIAFTNVVSPCCEIWVMNADGSNAGPLATPALGYQPAWSPDGQRIAFVAKNATTYGDIYTMNVDGSGEARLTDDRTRVGPELTGLPPNEGPNWSPDGRKLVFTHFDYDFEIEGWIGSLQIINAEGTERRYFVRANFDSHDYDQPVWSPDSREIVFELTNVSAMYKLNSDGNGGLVQLTDYPYDEIDPDWQPINPAPYPRPVGASPTYISLVPAFAPCDPASANATHRAPLSGSSCNPPAPSSSAIAVGPRSLGFTLRRVLATGQCAAFDSARCFPDVTIHTSITDVRAGSPTGPDYDSSNPSGHDLTATATLPGEAQGKALRITDLDNQSIGDPSGPYDKSATVVALSFPIPIDCTPTSDSSVGSSCDVATTANTLVPGSAVAGKRAIWQIGQFQVLDQGQNGMPGDSDDQVFEVQGLFAP